MKVYNNSYETTSALTTSEGGGVTSCGICVETGRNSYSLDFTLFQGSIVRLVCTSVPKSVIYISYIRKMTTKYQCNATDL